MRARLEPPSGLPVVADFRLRARTVIVTASLGDEGQVELASVSRGNAWVNCRPARSVTSVMPNSVEPGLAQRLCVAKYASNGAL